MMIMRRMRWMFLNTGHSAAQAGHDRCIVFVHHLIMITLLTMKVLIVLINSTRVG